jgi:hypothetical protein
MALKLNHEFPVDGKPGWKIEYILGNYYHLRVFTFVNDKVYSFWHRDYTLDAPKTFPIANKMVESFQVNTEDEVTSNNSTVEDTSNNSTFEDYQNKDYQLQ